MQTTEKLAQFIVESSLDRMPPEAIETAKRGMLDCVGVTFAGAVDATGRIVTEFVRELGGNPIAAVIGGGFRTSAPLAALANGTMAHVEDYDDICLAMMGHPTVPLLPAILAIGEQSKATGREAIEAYIVGFETECRIARGVGLWHYVRGWHATSTMGTMGAASACAKLLKLDVQQTRMALGIAASLASGLRQNFGTMTKPFHPGNAARSGVEAAMLAKKGFTASPNIIEARFGFCDVFKGDSQGDLEQVTAGLGETFEIVTSGITFKPYPSCGETHAAIDLVLELVKKHNISPQDVESMEGAVEETMSSVMLYNEPKRGLEGKFSLEYCMARALLDGWVGLEHFTDEKVNEPKIKEIIKRVKRRIDSSIPILAASVTIKLTDGRQFSQRADVAKGTPQLPLSREELTMKYKNCARRVLSPKDVERSLGLMENLEKLEDVTELMEIVIKPKQEPLKK